MELKKSCFARARSLAPTLFALACLAALLLAAALLHLPRQSLGCEGHALLRSRAPSLCHYGQHSDPFGRDCVTPDTLNPPCARWGGSPSQHLATPRLVDGFEEVFSIQIFV